MNDRMIQDPGGATAQRTEREMTEVDPMTKVDLFSELGRTSEFVPANEMEWYMEHGDRPMPTEERAPEAVRQALPWELTKRQQAVMDVITAHPGLDADSIACVLDSQTVAIERIVQGLYLLGQITTERSKHARDEYYARPIR